ncbi:tyrosine-type recombinase/integrase [Chromobacterium sp.]|uniref:tyrosine-type recombinase/integrase n=1 Tax=Chromobacterium sp. TaxID=306190 RepID=UPI0035B399B6
MADLPIEAGMTHSTLRAQTLFGWRDEFLSILARRKLKPKTLCGRANNLRWLCASLGDIPLQSIRPAHIVNTIKPIWESGRQFTARRVLIEAKDLFNEAIYAELMDRNPAIFLRALPTEVRRARLTLAQWESIHQRAGEKGKLWFQHALRLALATAQRRADIARLSLAAIWDEHLHIEQQKNGTKVAIPLQLYCPPLKRQLGDIIAETQHYRAGGQYLVRKTNGMPYEVSALTVNFASLRDEVIPITEWEGLEPATFHEIRSLSERIYRPYGINTNTLLGHTSQAMTDGYNGTRRQKEKEWRRLVLHGLPPA